MRQMGWRMPKVLKEQSKKNKAKGEL